jgi:hypothetical protein
MKMEQELDLGFSSTPQTSANGQNADGSSLKMSPVCSAHMKGGILLQWLESWLGANLVFHETAGEIPVLRLGQKDSSNGSFWTRNSCEWNPILAPCLKDDGVCSLSEILETGEIDSRYFLSQKACTGILRRAEKRGKVLPELLEHALKQVVGSAETLKRGGGVSRPLKGCANMKHREDNDTLVAGTLSAKRPGGNANETDFCIPQVVGTLSDGAHQGGGGLMDRMPTQDGLSRCLTGKMWRLDSETETFVVTK